MVTDIQKLINSLRQARVMDYAAGTYGNNLHEETMENIFMNNGLGRVEAPYYSLDIEDLGGYLVSGEFMPQPCGSYHSPDFIVRIGDTIFPIELKSSKEYRPVFGSTPPKAGVIYIFTSKIRGTSIVLGDRIVPPDYEQKCIEIDQKVRAYHKTLLNEYNFNNLTASFRLTWKATFGWFDDVENYFDEVVNFVYGCTGLKVMN